MLCGVCPLVDVFIKQVEQRPARNNEVHNARHAFLYIAPSFGVAQFEIVFRQFALNLIVAFAIVVANVIRRDVLHIALYVPHSL